MKRVFIYLVLLLIIQGVQAQSKRSFRDVDTSTYSAYIHSDWNKIISIGEQALKDDLDYYYLRLRIAYAYYQKKQYRKAIKHYKKALEFSHRDAIASEYLYYSFVLSGRQRDAFKLKGRLKPAVKKEMGLEEEYIVREIAAYMTYGNGPDLNTKRAIIENAPTDMEGSQIIQNQFFDIDFFINHPVSSSILARHHFDFLYKDEYALAVVQDTAYLSESQTIRQFNYHLALDITPVYGLTIKPSLSYVNYRVPIYYEYGQGLGRNREVYYYDVHNEVAFGLSTFAQFDIWEIALSLTHSNFNLSQQNALGFSGRVYPLANNQLYLGGKLFLLGQTQNSYSETQYIKSLELGGVIAHKLYVDISAMFGDFTNFYNPFNEITYNSLEIYQSIIGINLSLPINKSGSALFLGFRNYQSETMFVPIENVMNTYNNQKLNYQTITGGISWKL